MEHNEFLKLWPSIVGKTVNIQLTDKWISYNGIVPDKIGDDVVNKKDGYEIYCKPIGGRVPVVYSGYILKVEEVTDSEGKAAIIEAERRYPCKELQDKLAGPDELTEKENRQLFKNMDRQMAFFAALRWAKKITDPYGLEIDRINRDGTEQYRIAKGGNDAKA